MFSQLDVVLHLVCILRFDTCRCLIPDVLSHASSVKRNRGGLLRSSAHEG